ncbi:MAG: septum formation protein Maf [Paludibacteraceae bacterium]|nr:septum formation protein Maf [Paludibacteraceae bacterium]
MNNSQLFIANGSKTVGSTLNSQLSTLNVILGSQSPRRKELLGGLDIEFTTKVIPGLEETYPDTLQGEEIPVYLAEQKADAYTLEDNDLLITADTIVWLDGRVYGKPTDEAEAREMLRSLSGKTHDVITGVCVRTNKKNVSFASTTKVRFAELTEEEINHYVEKYRPMDKAGSYGVQEWIGYIGVEHIEGSYFNVMGLPIQKLYTVLKEF